MPNVMAAQPNISGALYESIVIPFLVPRRKVWLRPAAGVPRSNAANIRERLGRKVNFARGKIPSRAKRPQKCIYGVDAQETAKHHAKFGLPPVSDVTAVTKPRCKICWKLLGCPNLPNVRGQWTKFTRGDDVWRRYCSLTSFFPIVDTCLSCEDTARQSSAMVPRWQISGDFLHPVFSASRVQHIWDLHSKFALRPHYVWKYGRHPICDGWE